MKNQFWLSAFLTLGASPAVEARKVVVDDPGTGNTVLARKLVPNVLGFPESQDPPLHITSNVPVSILRYYDGTYLEGQQPVQKQDVYVVVKSDCSTKLNVLLELSEYNRTSIAPWDTLNYTDMISIQVGPGTVPLMDTEFLEPSSFLAYWNYTSFFCHPSEPFTSGPTSILESTPAPTTPSLAPIVEATTPEPTPAPAAGNGSTKGPKYTLTAQSTPAPEFSLTAESKLESNSAGVKLGGLLTTILAGVLGLLMIVRNNGPLPRGSSTTLTFLAIMGILLVSIHGSNEETLSQHAMASVPHKGHGRQLQEETRATCAASVEIILDGCRRAMLDDKLDVMVDAPAVRIIEMEVTPLSSEPTQENKCTFDYVASIDANLTSISIPAEKDGIFLIDSLTEDWSNGIQCARPIEGRPFVDDHGAPLHAQIETHQAAWSADKPDIDDITMDSILGQEWADRALGEHASVPAFAAFTIALMSNNAPPRLVEDALTAAMDEVRHAKTSFEVASLLLGTIVEPGPIPPSTHTFEGDMKAMALAAAQEGCVDETLSALAAAYDVDTRLDQNFRISDATKSMLKDKVRTIALEEARHSGLAWRTVHWACQTDSEVCSHVKKSIFESEYLQRAFDKRFGRNDVNVEGVQEAWQKVTSTLIPFVLASEDLDPVDCKQVISRHLNGITLLEEMARHIVHNTICA